MKTNFRKPASLILGTMMLAGAISPLAVLAQEITPADAEKGFCRRLPERIQRLDQRIADLESRLKARREERRTNMEKRRNNRDARRQENRQDRQENFAEHIAKLEARATTDAQKQAVATFKAAVEAAFATRNAAVNAAIQTFRNGVDQAVSQRNTAVDAAISAFKSSRQAAADKAKADCVAGADPGTVRREFRASMKAAREKFHNDRLAIEKLRTSFEPLRTARREAIDKAQQEFKTAMEKARADLRAAFGAP